MRKKRIPVLGFLVLSVVALVAGGFLLLPARSTESEVKILDTYTEAYESGTGFVCIKVKNLGKDPCLFVVEIYDREWEGWRKSDPQDIQPGEEKITKFGGDFIFMDISSVRVETFSKQQDLTPLPVLLVVGGLGALIVSTKIDRYIAGKYMLMTSLLLWVPGLLITWILAARLRIGGSTEVWFSGMERAEPSILVPSFILIPLLLGLVFLISGLLSSHVGAE